jgi:hypothetical protein
VQPDTSAWLDAARGITNGEDNVLHDRLSRRDGIPLSIVGGLVAIQVAAALPLLLEESCSGGSTVAEPAAAKAVPASGSVRAAWRMARSDVAASLCGSRSLSQTSPWCGG